MKRILLSCAAIGLFSAAWGQRAPERLGAWRYYKEVQIARGASGMLDFVLDRETLDRARMDAADIRLYDRADREIPYLLRILRQVETSAAYPAREFNRGIEGGAAQIYCDLGGQPQEHNQVEIETTGSNFRRLAAVEGSSDNLNWSTLAVNAILFRFASEGRTVEQPTIAYPASRYRFLRIRVNRDPQVDRAPPEITRVNVRRSVQVKGEMLPITATIQGREPDRINARPGSVWRLDLGARVPVQRLVIGTSDTAFSRPFQLEAADDPSAPLPITSGDLTRREDAGLKLPAIDFQEIFTRRLRLTFTDDRNTPLSITAVTAFSTARQVAFTCPAANASPIRMYYGNPHAQAPHYDLAARVPAGPGFPTQRVSLGRERDNPNYSPEPKPLSERAPWLIYAVLAAAGLALAAILIDVMRAAERKAA